MDNRKPQIIFTKNTPYMAVGVKTIRNETGNKFETMAVTPLCRCGKTKKEPYCDGAHEKEGGLNEVKSKDRVPYKPKDYIGEDIIVHFNLGVCCHDGYCVEALPKVFDINKRPWIQPDKGRIKDIIKVIEKCPSGALSFTIGSKRYDSFSKEPLIIVDPKGPFEVWGNIQLIDEQNTVPECNDHYTLCRCGKSKNKPFCDGEHTK